MRSLALAFVLVVPGTLAAQAAPATFMDWGRVSSSLYSDPVMGVQLWIGTSLRTTGAAYAGAGGTCAVYCHGSGTELANPAGKLSPDWTDTGLACGDCHGQPPA